MVHIGKIYGRTWESEALSGRPVFLSLEHISKKFTTKLVTTPVIHGDLGDNQEENHNIKD